MTVDEKNGNIILNNVEDFDLQATLDSGQCFRYFLSDGKYTVMSRDRRAVVSQNGKTVTFYRMTFDEWGGFWRNYFDLDRDYGTIRAELSRDPILKKAAEFAPGIRILNQDPFETLINFIISQNNNIPRIKGIVERLCENFGTPAGFGYAYPRPEKLASLDREDFAPLRAGFRDKYILDAARKVASGEVAPENISGLTTEEAEYELMKIKGVGKKVAQCVLLFGFHRLDAFPVDVWIKRALEALYPDGTNITDSPYAGIAQQYIFYYARSCPELFKD